ncbi:MAG: hypothetical protein AB7V58_01395 [Solirubrobacterales bacterium]
MKSNAIRALVGVAAVALAVVLFVVLQDDGDSAAEKQEPRSDDRSAKVVEGDREQPKPSIPKIVVRNGKPVGGVEELTYSADDRVRFKVESDVHDEVHLHGYDISKDVAAGGSVSFDFPANLEGIFEVELEHRAEPIAELQVNP